MKGFFKMGAARSEYLCGQRMRMGFAFLILAAANLASAQSTCTAIPQRVLTNQQLTVTARTTTASQNIAGWTASTVTNSPTGEEGFMSVGSGGVQHWSDQWSGAGQVTPSGFDTLSQALTNVSGGAVVSFEVAWNNSNGQNSSNQQDWDGNQEQLVVRYVNSAGVVTDYLTFVTSPFVSSTANGAPGPSAGAAVTLSNGATSISTPTPGITTYPALIWTTLSFALPDNVAQSGNLTFAIRRMEDKATGGNSGHATDDIYLRNVNVYDRTLCLIKSTPIGSGTFSFTSTNLDTNLVTVGSQNALSITTTGATPVAYDADSGTGGAQPSFVNANPVTVTETVTTGFNLTSATCDNGVTGTISGGNLVTFSTVPPGTQATCTLTNSRPRIQLQKALPAGRVLDTALLRDQFTLTITGPRNASTTTVTTTTTGTGNTATGTADFNPGDAGGTYTLSESAAGSTIMGLYTSSYSCNNATSGSSTTLPSGTGTSFTLTPAAADNITCTFTNSRKPAPTVTIRKTSLGSTGTFNFSGTNGIANQAITTATVGTPQAGTTQTLTAGLTATTVTEAVPPAGFILQSITCTGLGAGGNATPTISGASGGSVLLDAAATAPGSNIVCTFTNTNQADLSITKTDNATSVVSGANTVYSITVANNGPVAATGAIVKDPAVSGLTCVDPVPCSGASCPSAAVPLATLQGSGVVMGTMASGSSATFTLTCKAN